MASGAVVGTLRALLTADTAEFEQAMSSATKAMTAWSRDWQQVGVSAENVGKAFTDAITRDLGKVNQLAKEFSGANVAKAADEMAAAVGRIGGASMLTEAEQRKVNSVVSEAIEKYRALGQEAPAHLLALQQATQKAADATGTEGAGDSLIGKLSSLKNIVVGIGILKFAKDIVETGSHLVDLSTATGISTSALQDWQSLGVQVNVTVDQFAHGVQQLQKRLAGGDGSAEDALKRMGLSLDNLLSLTPDEMFRQIAVAVSEIPDPAQRTKAAFDLLGKSGADLIPLLLSNVNELGVGVTKMSDDTIKSADAFDDALNKMFLNLKAGIANAFTSLSGFSSALQSAFGGVGSQAMQQKFEGDAKAFGEAVERSFHEVGAIIDRESGSAFDGLKAKVPQAARVLEEFNAANKANEDQMRKSWAATDQFNAAVQALADVMTGKHLAEEIKKVDAALALAQTQGGLTAEETKKLVAQVSDLIQAGGRLTPRLHDWFAANVPLTQVLPLTAAALKNIGIEVTSLAKAPPPLPPTFGESVKTGNEAVGALLDTLKKLHAGIDAKDLAIPPPTGLDNFISSMSVASGALTQFAQISGGSMGTVARAFGMGVSASSQLAQSLKTLESDTASTAAKFAASANVYVLAAEAAIAAFTYWHKKQEEQRQARQAGDEKDLMAMTNMAEAQKKFATLFAELPAAAARGQNLSGFLDDIAQKFIDQADKAKGVWSIAFQAFISEAKAAGYEVKGLSDLLDKQKTQLSSASAGLAHDLAATIQQSYDEQTKTVLASLDAQIAKYKDNADDVATFEKQKADYIKGVQQGIVASTQDQFDRVGRIILASFNTLVSSGVSAVDAMGQIGGGLDELIKAADTFGFSGNAAFDELKRWRGLTTELQPVLDSVNNLNAIMVATASLGGLTADSFADLQAQGLSAYQALVDGGMTAQEAEMAEKGFLETIIQLHKDKGLAIDEATQKLIDQAKADGVLGAEQESTQDVLKEGLGEIITLLGGELPDAWKKFADSGKDAADKVSDSFRSVGVVARDAFKDLAIDVPVHYSVDGMPNFGGADVAASIGAGLTPMATGGIVMSPTRALIGESGPEAVIPLDQLGGRGGGSSTVILEMDGQRLGRVIVPHFVNETKRLRLTR